MGELGAETEPRTHAGLEAVKNQRETTRTAVGRGMHAKEKAFQAALGDDRKKPLEVWKNVGRTREPWTAVSQGHGGAGMGWAAAMPNQRVAMYLAAGRRSGERGWW